MATEFNSSLEDVNEVGDEFIGAFLKGDLYGPLLLIFSSRLIS